MRTTRLGLFLLSATLLAPVAQAGVVDSPLPTIIGDVQSKHIFTVTGVIQSAELATTIACTSLEKRKSFSVGVQVFDLDGTLLFTTSNLVGVGRTRTFSFGETTFGGSTESLTNSNELRSARVVANSKKLTCVALVVERQADGLLPAVAWRLPVIKKTSHKGD